MQFTTTMENSYGLIFSFFLSFNSAAKAPYLARFKVQHCGIQEMENKVLSIAKAGTTSPTQNSIKGSMGKEYWQAAIFKVGDDVRQVCF